MNRITHFIWQRAVGLLPGELNQAEVSWLASPQQHLPLMTRRRAAMIVNRVRLFASLFAILTPLWIVIDVITLPYPLSLKIATLRLISTAAFWFVVRLAKPDGNLKNAYQSMAYFFAIPTLFYVFSHYLMTGYNLYGISAAIGTGYAFLPFVLLAGFSIFPLTLIENIAFAAPVLIAQGIAGFVQIGMVDWPSFSGAFWLMALIAGVSALAGISQLAFMIVLVHQAVRDPLTGTFSRRSGEEVMELQFIISTRSNTPFAVAFLDMDHFKSVNDEYGHEAGDRVLKQLTHSITQNLRRGDILTRWGGEEFVLILPNTDRTQAIYTLNRLRSIGFGLRPDGKPVTASVGIAERLADQMDDWRHLVERADQRMYLAKHAGRDRIFAEDDVESTQEHSEATPA